MVHCGLFPVPISTDGFPEDKIRSIRQTVSETVCAIGVGGALLMRPLLLHASSPSRAPEHRRVIHLDFAGVRLPAGMSWFSERPSRTEPLARMR